MKYKIAICKIQMIGSPVLVLGLCHYDHDAAFWDKYQFFTMEDHPQLVEERDRQPATEWNPPQRSFHDFWGTTVHFHSINQTVPVFVDQHSFDFGRATAIELTRDQWLKIKAELADDGWSEFDDETWGK